MKIILIKSVISTILKDKKKLFSHSVVVLMTEKLHQLYILLSKRENSHGLMFQFISAFNAVITGYIIYQPFEI